MIYLPGLVYLWLCGWNQHLGSKGHHLSLLGFGFLHWNMDLFMVCTHVVGQPAHSHSVSCTDSSRVTGRSTTSHLTAHSSEITALQSTVNSCYKHNKRIFEIFTRRKYMLNSLLSFSTMYDFFFLSRQTHYRDSLAAWCSGQSFWKCSTDPQTRQQPPACKPKHRKVNI